MTEFRAVSVPVRWMLALTGVQAAAHAGVAQFPGL